MTRWFIYKWGKPIRQKFHWVILRLLLSRIHYYQNKWLQVKESQYFISTYSWTLIPIPNWTCSIVIISYFQYMDSSTWLTNRCADLNTWLDYQLENMLAAKFFSSSHDEDHETPWSQNPCTNTVAFSRERWTMENFVFGHNLHEHNFASHSCNCATFDGL